jgi:hypothetical protein
LGLRRFGKVTTWGHYGGGQFGCLRRRGLTGGGEEECVEFLLRIGIEVFQIGVGVALVEVVMVRDAPVLDDAVQLQAELNGAERQTAAFLFQRVGDDGLDLNGGIVEQALVRGMAAGA